jgi:sugar lactone lactonase YvrE
MAIRKDTGAAPRIERVSPEAAITGGEIQVRGAGLSKSARPRVMLGDVQAPLVIGSDSLVIVRVPDGAAAAKLTIGDAAGKTASWPCQIGTQIADSLHPVANPAVDAQGNVFSTLSGAKGQKTPVAVYKIDPRGGVTPFIPDLMNASGLAFDREGSLFVSSRFNGIVYKAAADGRLSVHVEGMGVATGMAFDAAGDLYVGDRSGTIFKIGPERQIYVFATLEPSVSAYHLAFGPGGYLYVTGPTTSSFDSVHRISPAGAAEVFYRGLGRPQGMAFDAEGRLYVCASLGGRKGIVRFGEDRTPELFLSGPNIVGLAFTPSKSIVVATTSLLYRVDVNIKGRPLP